MAAKSKKSTKKSTKKSNGAARKLSFEKQTPQHYKSLAAGFTKGKAPTGSGELIRARLVEGKLSTDDILKEVHKKIKGSDTKKSDVYWQRGRLKKEGITLPKVERAAPAKKAAKPAAKKSNKKAVKKARAVAAAERQAAAA